MSWKLKLFTAFNAVGWLVVVPLLAGSLLDPFVDFRNWPGGSLFDSRRDGVRLADTATGERRSPASRRRTGSRAPARVIALAGGVTVTLPAAPTAGSGGSPEARPGLQNRLDVGTGTVDERAPIALREAPSFADSDAPGAGGPAPAPAQPVRPEPETSEPPAAPPTAPPAGGGSPGVPTRGVDRPEPETPAQPTRGSGATPEAEEPAAEEPNAPAPVTAPNEPDAVSEGARAPVEAPEAPAAPDPDVGSGNPEPPPAPDPPEDGEDDKAVQPPKQDGLCDDDDGPGKGNGGGNGNGNGKK